MAARRPSRPHGQAYGAWATHAHWGSLLHEQSVGDAHPQPRGCGTVQPAVACGHHQCAEPQLEDAARRLQPDWRLQGRGTVVHHPGPGLPCFRGSIGLPEPWRRDSTAIPGRRRRLRSSEAPLPVCPPRGPPPSLLQPPAAFQRRGVHHSRSRDGGLHRAAAPLQRLLPRHAPPQLSLPLELPQRLVHRRLHQPRYHPRDRSPARGRPFPAPPPPLLQGGGLGARHPHPRRA